MSHHATNWAIQQRGLKPTTKIVLWHLCDRHNPDYGCFPSQQRLAHDCEISRSTLNVHLDRLETAGLIRRVTCIDPVTKRQKPTRYVLGFETQPDPDEPDPCPGSGHGAMSGFYGAPCPEKDQCRVLIPDTNPVREPLREPVKEEEDARAREAVSDAFFGKLLEALGIDPKTTLPVWWQGWPPREHIRRWRDDLGLSEIRILEVAVASRQTHPAPPDGPKALDRAMERAARSAAQPTRAADKRRKRRSSPTPPPDDKELAVFYADMVNADGYLPPSAITNRVREILLSRGLVTPERLRMRGLL